MTGKELQQLRKAHGLTQKALAAMLGYAPNYIARLEQEAVENGKTLMITPRFEKLLHSMLPAKRAKKSV